MEVCSEALNQARQGFPEVTETDERLDLKDEPNQLQEGIKYRTESS